MYCKDRLFKAVQDTLPDNEKVKRIESKEDVAKSVSILLEKDHTYKSFKNVRK